MKRWAALASAVCVAVLVGCGGSGGGGGAYGLDARVAPSGIQVPVDLVGGAATQVVAVDAFPNVRHSGPTSLTGARDGTNRLFVTDRNGVIHVFDNRADASSSVFMDLSSRTDDSAGENGMLGLVFDPAFASNRRFYVSYVYVPNPSAPSDSARTVRISRFTANAAGTAADPASEVVIFEYAHPATSHFGGWIGFGPEPDGRTLYISTGDGENVTSVVQDNASVYGKVLRIRLSSDGGSYTIPSDNPFGASNPVWAMGFRNPWRCSFDRSGNGELRCGDVGQSSYEELNLVRAGRNYGWPYCEALTPYASGGQSCSSYEQPLHYYSHAVGVAVIGGYVYRGGAMPGLVGQYLFSDAAASTLWSLPSGGGSPQTLIDRITNRATYSMGEDDSGEVYAVAEDGAIYRFEAANGTSAVNPSMPATLSATGLFTDLSTMTPAPGMVDYEVNSPLWSDGAQKSRWFVVPEGQSIGFSASGSWTFPVGTITVKHFELPQPSGGTTRVETRVMVHRANGWTGYTYRWRSDQSDADLLTSGGTATYQSVDPATRAAVAVNWTFPSQTQCMTCHTQVSGRVLGLRTRQLNGSHTYASTGRSDNQLRTLGHVGLLAGDIGSPGQYDALPNPTDTSAPLEARAKAYLDSNCSMCHQPGGPTPVADMDLRFPTALADMRLVGVAATQSGGTRVVAGDHASSVLWQRVGASGGTRMPPLGTQLVDQQALQLLADWMDGLR